MRVIEHKGFTIVGVRVDCRVGELAERMPDAWRTVKEHSDIFAGWGSEALLEACLFRKGDETIQIVGVVAPDDAEAPEPLSRIEISEGSYVTMEHTGPLQMIWPAFAAMTRWARKHGHEPDPNGFRIEAHPTKNDRPIELFVRLV